MMECLAQRGVQTLLVEAGGELLSQFLAADALDELYVTLCPVLIGGKTPGLVGGTGFSLHALPHLTLMSSEVVGDEIFLHYRVNREAKTAKS
jgi:5-amino-6-(5-phosphoribosylamino)uracil reductase